MKILPPVAVCLAIAAILTLSARAQTLGDAARKAEEERSKAKQGPGTKVFTNKDLGDAPPAPPPAGAAATASSPNASDTEKPIGNRCARFTRIGCLL